MKNFFLIILFSVFILLSNISAFTILSDTLVNKGAYSTDTLLTSVLDSTLCNDSLVNSNVNYHDNFIRQTGIDDSSNYITRIPRYLFSTEDYRNFSDILTYSPFFFLQDLGSIGQSNEQMMYGLGFDNISFMRDGILLNNRFQNSYDLNKLNNEIIDSVEVATITKGFLYSAYNNPISLIFTNRSKFPTRPITQLKFYQASFDEGMVDVLFHLPVTNKFSVGLNVSNTAIDSRFSNSDYESWKINSQIFYQINDKVNISANYFFSYDTLALFGGLDTNVMLNENFSPVLYESSNGNSSRYKLTYDNSGSIKVLSDIFPNLQSDLTLYFNSSSQKFIQNTDKQYDRVPSINHGNYFHTYGVSLRNIYSLQAVLIDVIANYESSFFQADIFSNDFSQNIFSISGDIKLPIIKNEYFVPSVFGKVSRFGDNTLVGYGADISGSITNNFSYYAGASYFQKQVSILEKEFYYNDKNNFPFPSDNKTMEVGVKFKFDLAHGKISYFNYMSNNSVIPYTEAIVSDSLLINEISTYTSKNINNSGLNINIIAKLWKFTFSNNLSYYFNSREDRVYASPDYTLAGKIYYNDILFNNNLKLKTGVNYRYTGGQLPFVYDFETLAQITDALTPMVSFDSIPPSLQLDLFLAGTIQERATIFVTLENTLDSEYYIVPYYFKQPITLRFGVSWLLYD